MTENNVIHITAELRERHSRERSAAQAFRANKLLHNMQSLDSDSWIGFLLERNRLYEKMERNHFFFTKEELQECLRVTSDLRKTFGGAAVDVVTKFDNARNEQEKFERKLTKI